MKIVEIRPIEGANIYCHKPVIEATLGLGGYAEVSTASIPGFCDSLTGCLPSLREHYCSRGEPGGFIERLAEGTYMGHVVEHVALELQHLAGMNVFYGKTISTDVPGVYKVITEYESKEGGVQALRSALEIVAALLENRQADIQKELSRIREIGARYNLGPSTAAIAREAQKRGIPVMRLGEGSILQLGYGKYHQKVEATITGRTKCIGVDIAGDKVLVKQLLAESGIPVPWGGIARTEQEALEIAAQIGEAVVVKPYDGNQGKGVSLNLTNTREVSRAMDMALALSPKAIIEKYIKGKHYRVTVVGDRVVAASERIPAFVVGDGYSSIVQLVEIVNQDPLRGGEHEKPLTKITIDSIVLLVLAKQGLTPESLPAKGEIIYLRENANLSTGGIAVDVTGRIHPETIQLVLRAVRLVGLDVAGVDLVAVEPGKPLDHENGAIIEINAAPGIRMHHYPAKGKARNVAGAIVDMLFPPGSKSRIPIVAVTGTNGKTTVTRIISQILQGTGCTVGATTTDGIYINGHKIVQGDMAGPRSAQVILRDPTVEVAVLETARGGIIKSGLGFDYGNVGIITNISNDHLGLDGIDTQEDMAYVKSVVAEAVHRNGYTVLNADDVYTAIIAERVRSGIIYFSMASDNAIVRRHLGIGETAVFVKNGAIVVAKGTKIQKVLPVKHVPCTIGGAAQHNVLNVLAAVAGCVALGTEMEYIREGLMGFAADAYSNPGRFNIFELKGCRVVLDYGHNEEGYKNILQTIKKLKPKRIVGVVGMPGDRKNKDIELVGGIAASYCDELIIKEDSDLRGRAAGEAAALIRKAALESGFQEAKIRVIPSEAAALQAAMGSAREGDIIVIFYEKLEPLLTLLRAASQAVNEVEAMTNKNSDKICAYIS